MREMWRVETKRGAVSWVRDGGAAWLGGAFGLAFGNGGEEPGHAAARGPALLSTSIGRFEADSFACVAIEASDGVRRDGTEAAAAGPCGPCGIADAAPAGRPPGGPSPTLRIVWRTAGGALELDSRWTVSRETGVLSRRDIVRNVGSATVTVFRCLPRFALPAGRYEVYAQNSRWSNENQGAWVPLQTGMIRLSCLPGRSSEGGTPYAGLRPAGGGDGLAMHVVPCGNWVIRISAHGVMNAAPSAVIEAGLADEDLRIALAPGAALELPEVLLQAMPGGEPEEAAPDLQGYALARWFAPGAGLVKPVAPVCYNTWFDQFEILDVPRLRRQLAAATEMGCEAFVIDAGWYGADVRDWHGQAGNWREKQESAFRGSMKAFADEVRAAGLGFGIWMEPERVGESAPVRKEHPDWFVPVGRSARFDLGKPAARAWLRAEIGRLVETYGLAWMKLDFNFEMDRASDGSELSAYAAAWYGLMDEVRRAYPATFFEGCASGAMRLDLNSLSRFDNHFLSDTVNPVDVLRITQGALLRLPPGRLGKWAVLRSVGPTIPEYTRSVEEWSPAIVTPAGASWDGAGSGTVAFVVRVAMTGMLGFSGDPGGLPESARAEIRSHVEWYKKWRGFIAASAAHPLTPVQPIHDRTGWVGLQLQAPGGGTSLVFAFRLAQAEGRTRLRLRGLEPERGYAVQRVLDSEQAAVRMTGDRLMREGVWVTLPGAYSAAVLTVTPG